MIDINNPYTISYVNFVFAIFVAVCLFIYRKIFLKQKINFIFLLIILGFLSTLSIFREGTYRSGDLTTHTNQLINFYQNLIEGELVPRWAGDLCGGYGCPVYIIEYLAPYYLASIFHFIGFSFLMSMKLVLVSSFVFSGITMYLWAREEFGKAPGFISALFYLYAPYHLIDLHFRGSVGEVMSFVFIPLLFLFAKKLIELNKLKYFFLEAILVGLLILTHSSTTLVCLPLAVGYGVVVWLRLKKRRVRDVILLLLSIIYGITLVTFYWLTALNGAKYTWWVYTTFGDFKPIWEYIYSPILFGFLFQGHQGEFRLIIGYFHVLVILISLFWLFRNKIDKHVKLLLQFFLLAFFILFFMLLSISKPLWENISLLHTFIVVWRLLVPIAFITSAIAGIVAMRIKSTKLITLVCFLLLILTVPNWANRKMVPLPKSPFLHEAEIYTEYFEKNNPLFEENLQKRQPQKFNIVAHPPVKPLEFLKGKGEFTELRRQQIEREYVLHVQEGVVIKENTNFFPGWKVYVNDKEIAINYKDRKNVGKIIFSLPKGLYKVIVRYESTQIVQTSQLISTSSVCLGIIIFLLPIIKKRFRNDFQKYKI